MKRTTLMMAALAIGIVQAMAQQLGRNEAEQHNGWLPVNIITRVSDKWGLTLEGQYRSAGPVTETQQILLRGSIDHYTTESVTIAGGYAYILTYPYGEQPIMTEFREHRGWQQVALSHKAGRFSMGHRYRLEQRWLQKQQAELRDEYLYLNRLRYRVLVNIPINRKAIEPGCVFATFANETFVSFGKNVRYNVFDQNRAFAGAGIQLPHNLQVQAGYLNQLLFKSNGIDYENNHTYQLGFTWKPDLRKPVENK
jgi:hypothetical protein